jgi:hypothetical protein
MCILVFVRKLLLCIITLDKSTICYFLDLLLSYILLALSPPPNFVLILYILKDSSPSLNLLSTAPLKMSVYMVSERYILVL